MSFDQLMLKVAAQESVGPSQFRQDFLREQVCNTPILGKVVRRIFLGV